jgi:hypothetical protein
LFSIFFFNHINCTKIFKNFFPFQKFIFKFKLTKIILTYEKLIYPPLKKNYFLTVMVLVLLLLTNCRKELANYQNLSLADKAKIEDKFFKTNPNLNQELKALALDLQKKDSIYNFLPSFVKKNGYPVWDKVFYSTKGGKQPIIYTNSTQSNETTTSSSGVFLIPCVDEETNKVKSYLVAKKKNSDTYSYQLYNKEELNKVNVPDSVKSNVLNTKAVFGYFEKQINGFNSYDIDVPIKQTLSNINLNFVDEANNQTLTVNSLAPSQEICEETNRFYIEVVYDTTLGATYTERYLVIVQECYEAGGSGWDGGYGDPSYGGGGGGNNGPGTGSGFPSYNPYYPSDPFYYPWFNPCGCSGGGGGGGISPPTLPPTYQLTQADYQILNQIEAEDFEADNNNSQCHGTARGGNVFWPGVVEHWVIQFDYITSFPGGEREYAIPQSSAANNTGYADIVNLYTNEIFEIKPVTLTALGALEADRYVLFANANCPTSSGGWVKGYNYPTKVLPYPKDFTKSIIATLDQPGLITYTTVDKSLYPSPQTVALPQNLADKLKIFMQNIITSNVYQNAYEMNKQILVFLQENPQIKDWLKIGAAGIMIATLIEDILTGGVGILDDWACFLVSRNMWRLAVAI